MREKILKQLAFWHSSYPGRMLILVIVITVISIIFAAKLETTMRVSDLLPEKNPRVIQFNKIIDEFATATNLIVVVQGKENQIKAFADELAPKITKLIDDTQNEKFKQKIEKLENNIDQLKPKKSKQAEIEKLQLKIKEFQTRINMKLFQRVDYKTEVDFLKNHLLMLVKEKDLKNTKDIYMDPNLTGLLTNLNNSMEKEYVGQEESISTREKEDGAVGFLDGIQSFVNGLQQTLEDENLSEPEIQKIAAKLLIGEPYMLSYDKSTLVMIAVPTFTLMDRDLLMVSAVKVQELVDEQLKKYPAVHAGLTGAIAREHDEQVYSEQAIGSSSLIALIFILILLMLSFRMILAPILALVTLIFGVIWAMGASWIAVGQLNMMTAMMSIILLGLGIDFAIHFITGFSEMRARGDDIATALEKTFLKNVKGIITGALTTACAFLTLLISEARGMRELGIVIGIGLLSILFATLIFLPVMLVLKEKFGIFITKKRNKTGDAVQRDISFQFLGRLGNWLSKKYAFTLLTAGIVTLILISFALQIKFDHNMMNIEPEGLKWIALQDTVLEKFDLSMEYSLILAESVEESRELSEKSREMGSVAMTDDISLYLPSTEEQQKRIPHITEVRQKMQAAPLVKIIQPGSIPAFIKEIERLEMNIIEMQDMAFLGGQDKVDNKCKEIVGDPDKPESANLIQEFLYTLETNMENSAIKLSGFQRYFAPYFKQSVIRLSSTAPIQLEELPKSILDRYCNRTRDQFLVTVYPAGSLWEDKEFLDYYMSDIDRVSIRATGSAPLFTSLIGIFARDGRNAILLTLVLVFILLWIDFKNPSEAFLAMIPLASGVLWMVGIMYLVGMKFNFINMIGLPLIIGIGIDDGVHIIHRWKYEGAGNIKTVFSSTGKAILLTSLTTMFAFGSLGFSVFRGWASFGIALAIGVGACFLTTTMILPGILGLIEKRKA